MENRVMTLLAGRGITELKFGKVDIGASSDIERAYRIVKRLVTDYCEFSFKNYYRNDRGEPLPQHISNEVGHEMDKYYLKCKELLANNMPLIDKVAKTLMKKELLSHSEIAEIIKNN
jgi:ATP-dependent Zn protease